MRGESIVFLVYWQKGSKPLDRFVVYTPSIRSMPWEYNVFVFSVCVCVCVCVCVYVCVCVSVNNFRVRSITLKLLDIFS